MSGSLCYLYPIGWWMFDFRLLRIPSQAEDDSGYNQNKNEKVENF